MLYLCESRKFSSVLPSPPSNLVLRSSIVCTCASCRIPLPSMVSRFELVTPAVTARSVPGCACRRKSSISEHERAGRSTELTSPAMRMDDKLTVPTNRIDWSSFFMVASFSFLECPGTGNLEQVAFQARTNDINSVFNGAAHSSRPSLSFRIIQYTCAECRFEYGIESEARGTWPDCMPYTWPGL